MVQYVLHNFLNLKINFFCNKLGDGSFTNRISPVAIVTTGIVGNIVDMVSGFAHTLLLTDANTVYALGSNTYGQVSLH
jgi:alpha-tubulin suppressor-like RCC1 family protein